MTRIAHEMILASAGSGKTYALTNRFVKLLALGVKPERIVALTFTRKAAGEFFDEILNKLARAAKNAEEAGRLAVDVGSPELTARDFRRMLREVVDAMHRLRLGTFDGFFARIARNFPFELGLTGEFEILQEHGVQMERGRVLRRMFERAAGAGGTRRDELVDAQREFIEAFKRATFGAEEKRLGAQLNTFLDTHQEVFLAAADPSAWGNPQRIWPEGSAWLAPAGDLKAAASTLSAWARAAGIGDKQRIRWEEFLAAVGEWTPGVVPSRPLAYVLEKALAAWSELRAGAAVLEFDRKKQVMDAEACAALAEITRSIVGAELARRLEITRGIHAVLASYEAVYHDAVRRAGKLTFADVQRLLQPGGNVPALSSGGDADGRLAIDYRLDGEIDHWLLDEFQDTSFGQWSVLRNLVDEAVQDPTGARSFFYVGDVKQAIYAWRDGDPRLFREIFEHYNSVQPGTIVERHLDRSWRSGPAVIEMVNAVFGAAATLQELFPGPASATWNREWRKHESAKPTLPGQAALLHAEDEPGRFAVALALLQEISPLERGLSCALLVQDNATGARLAEYLRHEGGLPAVAESDLHVCTDNPLGAALLALVQAAAFPGDTLAWEHVQMTPLGAVLASAGAASREAVTWQLLRDVHADGFEHALGAWVRRLLPGVPADDGFTRERARQFLAAAALFDATASRDVGEFVRFMERHAVRELDSAAVLRVMTIHKSKGLGFDVVLLPDLEGQKLDCRRDGLAVQRSADRAVEWVLDLPGKLFHGSDDVLSAHVRSAEANACYEGLSLLYVAMTRAKRAMYVIAKPPGTSTSRNFPKLLGETLGEETISVKIGRREFAGAYTTGAADWLDAFGEVGAAEPVPEPQIAPLVNAAAIRVSRLPARLPSGGKTAEISGAGLFELDERSSDRGTAIHALLAQVEWADAATVRELTARWRREERPEALVHEAEACLRAPALERVWRHRARADVWRERAFEVVLDGAWVTGVFDRVIVERDRGGNVVGAAVFDFKTDRASSSAEAARLAVRHAAQLNTYRQVVGRLTGLPASRVSADVVFTRLQQAVTVD